MSRVPKRLKNAPLVEAIWQAQFDHTEAGEVLPGILFSELRKENPSLQLHRLPTADLPATITNANPNLRYLTKIQMVQPDGPFLWQVGDQIVTLNCRRPYVGWQNFSDAIQTLIMVLRRSGVVSRPSLHSLRFINLLTLQPAPDLSALKIAVKLGDHQINDHLQMRVEIAAGECKHVVQIVVPAKAKLPEGERSGTLVDLETQSSMAPVTWDEAHSQLGSMHRAAEGLLFHEILTEQAIEGLGPEY